MEEERSQNVNQEDEVDDLEALANRFMESQTQVAFEDWSLKQKLIYFLDKGFLCFLALFLVILFVEVVYKIWYLVQWRLIFNYVVTWLISEDVTGEL
uniref:Uncharacterized protein n=1 Tax=Callorhinchus milii TaxID=7868 RepID=A0A4W3GUZ3_CALMI